MKASMNIRSIILVMATIGLASMFFINICFAGNTGKVSVETAKLREQPNTDCKVLELISQGEEVEILSEENNWYKIKYKKITGYVRQDLVQVENKSENTNIETNNETAETTNEVSTDTNTNTEQTNTNINQPTTTEPTNTVINQETSTEKLEEIVKSKKYKISDNTKLKVIPLISAIELQELTKGTEIEVTEILNDWVKVKTSDEKTGWIRKNKLSTKEEKIEAPVETTPKQPETQKPTVTSKTMYINSQKVNVRKEPNTTSQVLKQLTINTQVTVISTENNWCRVEIDGTKGYISQSLLSTKKQETSRSATTTRNPQNTSNIQTSEKQQTTSTTNQSTQTSTSTSTTTTSSKGSEVVAYAKQFLGCKYVYGGTTTKGFDCSGFTQYVYKHFGTTLNRTAAAQYSNGTYVSNLQAGDLVMFGKSGINHVGIYIGGNTFIHAANPSRGVTIDTLASGYYKTNYVGARRIF